MCRQVLACSQGQRCEKDLVRALVNAVADGRRAAGTYGQELPGRYARNSSKRKECIASNATTLPLSCDLTMVFLHSFFRVCFRGEGKERRVFLDSENVIGGHFFWTPVVHFSLVGKVFSANNNACTPLQEELTTL